MKIRSIISIVVLVLIVILLVSTTSQLVLAVDGEDDEFVPVTRVTINKTSLTMILGTTEIITATIHPWDATDKRMRWESSGSRIVEVASSGTSGRNSSARFTAMAPGTVNISVITLDGGRRATCQVEVIVLVNSIEMEQTELAIRPGETTVIQARVLPIDANDQNLTWESTNPGIATVDGNGNVIGKSHGKTRIVARSAENQNISAYSQITVSGSPLSDVSGVIEDEEQDRISDDESGDFELEDENENLGGSINISNTLIIGLGLAIILLITCLFIIFLVKKGSKKNAGGQININTERRIHENAPSKGQLTTHQEDRHADLHADFFDDSVINKGLSAGYIDLPENKVITKPYLKGISGYYAGQIVELVHGQLVIGRDPAQAGLIYPNDYEDISRIHCTVVYKDKESRFILIDSSSNGTFLLSGERLVPGEQYTLLPGDCFFLADSKDTFAVGVE